MTKWTRVIAGCVGLAVLAGCTKPSRPVRNGSAQAKTIILGATRLDPTNLTIGSADAVGFASTAGDPLQVEFIQPSDQTGITCRVTDPKQLERGEKPWGEFRMNQAGHLTAYVPPGPFLSTCRFVPGRYAYRVRVLDEELRPLEEKLGQLGSITVK